MVGESKRGRKRIAVMLALLLGLMAGLIGCGSATGTKQSQSGKAAATVPDQLVIAVPGEPDVLDPHFTGSSATRAWIARNVTDQLARWDPVKDEFVPQAAVKWEAVNDKTWRITLRQGVKFHNGKEMTAEDAAGSIVYGINDQSSHYPVFYPTVETAKVVDKYTFDIILKQPDPVFVRRLPQLYVMPKEMLQRETLASQLVGSGPYKLVEWRKGQYILLERNEEYWGQKGLFKQVKFIIRPEATVRANAVQAGEAQLAFIIGAEQANMVPKVLEVAGAEVAGFVLNSAGQKAGGSTMEDYKVRLAVNLAIDRKAIVSTVFKGRATLPNAQNVGQAVVGVNPALQDFPYDPTQAKQLIVEAGAKGKEVVIAQMSGRWAKEKELAETLAGFLREIGLNPRVQALEYPDWVTAYRGNARGAQSPFDIFMIYHSNEFFDASMKTFGQMKGGFWLMKDAEVMKTMDAAIAEPDLKKRTELSRESFRLIKEKALTLAIVSPSVLFGADKRIVWTPRGDENVYLTDIGWQE